MLLDPRLKSEIIDALSTAPARHAVSMQPGSMVNPAHSRAIFIREITEALYDEVKFRVGDSAERNSLGPVVSAAVDHTERIALGRDLIRDPE